MLLTTDVDIVVHGATGASFSIKAGEEKEVRECFLASAVEAGAYPVGDVKQEQTPADRTDVIVEAINALAEEGNKMDFDKKGIPKLAAISRHVGFKVTTTMRDVALLEQ